MSDSSHGYDYVVVGGGTAGLVLAARLSESPDAGVLVIEAGTAPYTPMFADPERWGDVNLSPADWSYLTVPQPGLAGDRVYSPAGFTLGGSSNINHMIHQRGWDADYDSWAQTGAHGWSARDVKPYFDRIEGRGGNPGTLPVISAGAEGNALSQAFIDACVELGYPEFEDYNRGQTGVGWHQMNIRAGERSTVRVGYYEAARSRPNLTVLTDARATRLVFRGTRCVGVEYVRFGESHTVRAEREVIVSSGAIESPKLLLLSGIGAAAQLAEFDIPVVADVSGVGENFQNQPLVVGPTGYAERPGPRTGTANESVLFWGSDPGLPAPDLELWFLPKAPWGENLITKLNEWKVTGDTSGVTEQDEIDPHLVILLGGVVRPYSRGTIRLASADPLRQPVIDPNFYAEPADLDRAVLLARLGREVLRTGAFARKWGMKEVAPGPGVSDGPELREWVRRNTGSFHHYTGSCRIGVDNMAVVDPRLRVRGVEGLRIADASVMPRGVSGHTHATVVVIAERAADFIKQDAAP